MFSQPSWKNVFDKSQDSSEGKESQNERRATTTEGKEKKSIHLSETFLTFFLENVLIKNHFVVIDKFKGCFKDFFLFFIPSL